MRWLRRRLRGGFWYPVAQSGIARIYSTLSIGYRFKESFSLYGDVPAGAAELYQFIVLSFGILWLVLVTRPLLDVLALPLIQAVGIGLALYFPTEFFLFSLDWVFAARKALRSARRSLASFILGFVEVSIFFTIAYTLANCVLPGGSLASRFIGNLFSLLRLQISEAAGGRFCRAMSHYQFVIGLWIAAIVIASLVGAVVRGEREN